MDKDWMAELPEEFKDGPWITGQEVMQWLGVSKNQLRTMRFRGDIAFTSIGTITMYNKPWIEQQFINNWTWKKKVEGKK